MSTYNLNRFASAQERDYATAFEEIKQGRKRSHWMWYIFPQIKGLGYSEMARHYAIADLTEAEAFLHHPVLGQRLVAICNELLKLQSNNANQIFGNPDDIKLRSSMTLFASVKGAPSVFHSVLQKFFDGKLDDLTLQKLGRGLYSPI